MVRLPDVHVTHADQPELGAPTHLGVESQHLARAQLGIKQVHLKIKQKKKKIQFKKYKKV